MLLASGLLCCCHGLQAQDMLWARNLRGQGYDAANAIAVDAMGNTYVAGHFTDVTDFDPGPGVVNLTSSGWDVFLLKLNAAGGFEWVKRFEASGPDIMAEPSDIAIDASGNIYISGNFGSFGSAAGTIDFDPGSSVYTLSTSGNAYTTNVFVVKLNAAGNFEWARQMGGNLNDLSVGVAISNGGGVLVAGNFKGTADFDPGTGVANLTASSSWGDMFIVELDNSGDYVWAKRMGGTEQTSVKSISTDAHGNIYTMGAFSGTTDFDPGTTIQNMSSAPGPYSWGTVNIFVSKLDAIGNYVWARKTGIPDNIYSNSINPSSMVADTLGNTYITGCFSDTADFDPGAGTANLVSTLTGVGDADVFVCKLDSSGNFVWAKGMGGITADMGYGIAADNHGNVYTIGTIGGPADFDPSDTGVYTITPASNSGLFISKLDQAGGFAWAGIVSGEGNSIGINGEDIALSPVDNSIHIASEFSDTVDFDPGPGVFNLDAASNNVFVLKLKNCSPLSSLLATAACDSFRLNGTTYLQSGTYTQTFSSAAGCDSVVTLNLTLNSLDRTVTKAGATLTAAQSGASYQWINCDGHSVLPGATQQSYTATQNGSYAVIITKGDCSDTSACQQVAGLSIDDIAEPGLFRIIPNPAKDQVSLVAGRSLRHADCRLVNILGQELLRQDELEGTQFTFDISGLASGIYILELREEGKLFRSRLVKK